MADWQNFKNQARNSFSFRQEYKEQSFTYEQLINYYPKHHMLDDLLTANQSCDHVNFFMDLKNIMQTVYMDFAVRYMLNDSQQKGSISSYIFESFLAYIGFHKEYMLTRGKTCKFYIFFESGDSGYHKRIYKDYKCNRSIDKAFGLEEQELRLNREIWQKNLILIEKVGNKLPDVKVLHMRNLEADFIPYYLMSRNKVDMSPNVLQLTYSTDHDLYQNLLLDPKCFTYWRRRQVFKILDRSMIVKDFAGDKKSMKSVCRPEYYPLLIAMCGDPGDDIPIPIKRAGVVRINKIVEEFAEVCGGLEQIYKTASNLSNNKLIPDNTVNTYQTMNTLLRKFIDENDKVLMNLRLMSFEVLSRVMENNPTGTMLESRKHIDDILTTNQQANMEPLIESLNRIKVFPEKKHISKIYFNAESSFEDMIDSF